MKNVLVIYLKADQVNDKNHRSLWTIQTIMMNLNKIGILQF